MASVVGYDVVVIGGGIAGLTAAKELTEKHGLSVVVLEARDRVGGRTCSEVYGDKKVRWDMGGQWIGPHQNEIRSLASELGVEHFPQPYKGTVIYDVNNQVAKLANGVIPGLSFNIVREVVGLLEVPLLMWFADSAMRSVPADHPHKSPNANLYDGMTCETWRNQNVFTDYSRRLFDVVIRGVFGCEPRDVSVLHFLAYVNGSGGIKSLVTIPEGHQESKFVNGSQTISDKIKERLGDDRVHLNSPVKLVDYTKDGVVVVRTLNGESFTAKRVVFAVPPPSLNHVDFSPPLPPARRQLYQRCFFGVIIKILILYETTFWRDKGFSGEVVCDNASGPCHNVYDESRPLPDDPTKIQPALVVFINGQPGRDWAKKPEDDRRRAVLTHLVRWFGVEAASPIGYKEKNWVADEWINGAPVVVWGPGALTAHNDDIRAPIGPIHFAGTETATKNQGFMDGAVQSGKRVAEEIGAILKK